nr:hypothetical protein [uncultured Duganella sp.]
MELPNKPTKEQIRQYMSERLTQQCSPPSSGDIRRQLGWGLVPSTDDCVAPADPQPRR